MILSFSRHQLTWIFFKVYVRLLEIFDDPYDSAIIPKKHAPFSHRFRAADNYAMTFVG